MTLPSYVRTQAGDVRRLDNRLVVSDDPKGVIGEVLHVAVTGIDHTTAELLAELRPGGAEYCSGAGHMFLWLEDEEDVPGEFVPPLTAEQLAAHEVWLVVLDTWGRGSEHAIVSGEALRELVRVAARALGRS